MVKTHVMDDPQKWGLAKETAADICARIGAQKEWSQFYENSSSYDPLIYGSALHWVREWLLQPIEGHNDPSNLYAQIEFVMCGVGSRGRLDRFREFGYKFPEGITLDNFRDWLIDVKRILEVVVPPNKRRYFTTAI